MALIAVYNLKGGVGKTTLAVNFAWCAARESARRTLLWDLDPQAAATHLLCDSVPQGQKAARLFDDRDDPQAMIQPSRFEGIDVLAADPSLRGIDRILFQLGKKKRLAKLKDKLSGHYDRVILDCPPGLTELTEQIVRAADLLIVPVTPSQMTRQAFEKVVAFVDDQKARRVPMLPVLVMVDRRRTLHRDAIAASPDWPVIPMASQIEQMGETRMPVGALAPKSDAARAFSKLWQSVERRLAE